MSMEDARLIAELVAGELDADGVRELTRRLQADPGLRRKLGAQLGVHGLLGPAMEDEVSRERLVGRYVEAVREDDREAFVDRVQRRVRALQWRRRVQWAAAVAALLVAGFTVVLMHPEPVATVVRNGVIGTSAGLDEGATLREGERLRFEAGLVELDMDGRGRMIVEGPADLEFKSGTRAVLHRGRVLMRVTEAGHGYRLETSQGSVVDLGTEFGVAIDEKTGKVETHVLEGEVNAVTEEGKTILLKKDDALRFENGASVRIPSDRGSFYSDLPPRHSGRPNMVHWGMDAVDGGVVRAKVAGMDGRHFDMVLAAMDAGGPAKRIDGPFGGALEFDGKGGYAESDFRGIGGHQPRTVAFWVRVPREFRLREGFGIVSWGRRSAPPVKDGVWQISINPLPEDGPVGRLRVGTHGGIAIGTADLRDGEWHHVAVVLYPAANPDVGKHVLLFVDGELEPISRRSLGEVRTEVENAQHGVWVGRNVAYFEQLPTYMYGGFFRGGVDEVFIFDAALSHGEIRALMERNEGPR